MYRGLLALTYTRPIYKSASEYLATEQNIQAWGGGSKSGTAFRRNRNARSRNSSRDAAQMSRGLCTGWGSDLSRLKDSIRSWPRRAHRVTRSTTPKLRRAVCSRGTPEQKDDALWPGGTDGVLDFANVPDRAASLPEVPSALSHQPLYALPDEPVDPRNPGRTFVFRNRKDDISGCALERQVDWCPFSSS